MRPDAKKNLQKVATEVLKDPLATQRALAKGAGVGLGTVNRATKELERNGTIDRSSTVVAIAETDLEIVTLGQSIILDKMKDKDKQEKMSIGEVSQVIERSQKRQAFIDGANSDEKGGERISDEKAALIDSLFNRE